MLMIRLQRIGRKNDPAFRMLVLEKASGPKAGSYVDLVGTYNPKTKAMTVDGERIKGWVAKGAQLSPSLNNLLIKKGIIEGTKSASVVSKKNLEKNVAKKKAEEEAALAKAAEAAKAPVAEAVPVEEVLTPDEAASVEAEAETVPEAVHEEAAAETEAVESVAEDASAEAPTEATVEA